MSYAEIWDDSTLVESWNEALEEYKHYHSIHARGEKVEDVLPSFDDKDSIPGTLITEDSTRQDATRQVEMPNGMNKDHSEEGTAEAAHNNPQLEAQSANKLSAGDQTWRARPSEGRSQGGPPPLLQHLVGTVHDEGLKSLLMSWYYAGYYTGLYEGQNQAR